MGRNHSPVALLYHGFAREPRERDPHALMVATDAFRSQLRSMLRGGWNALDLDGYIVARRRARRSREFLVTIDDGFSSVAQLALPILAELEVPAILFVPPAKIGGVSDWMRDMPDEPLLDVASLRDLAAAGIEIGVHGLDHRDLVDLSDAELRRQVVDAREMLGDLTGCRPRAFAYPSGVWDDRARQAIADAGYEVGFSVYRDGGDFAIPRVPITAKDSLGIFRLKLTPGYLTAWRVAGRAPALRGAARRVVQRVTGR